MTDASANTVRAEKRAACTRNGAHTLKNWEPASIPITAALDTCNAAISTHSAKATEAAVRMLG